MEHEDRRHLYARPRRRRLFRRRHRLRDVHASARRSRRLEHAARQRPLGADLSERALRVRQDASSTTGPSRTRRPTSPAFVDSVLPVVEAKRSETSATITRSAITSASCRRRAIRRPRRLHLRPRQGRGGNLRRSDALAAADALSGAVGEIRRRSGRRRHGRGAVSWSAIATPTRCAARRIFLRRRSGKSGARAAGFHASDG